MMDTVFHIVAIAAVVAGILASIAVAVQAILSIRADAAPRVSDEALLREHRRRVALVESEKAKGHSSAGLK